jgi:hypothetical protein
MKKPTQPTRAAVFTTPHTTKAVNNLEKRNIRLLIGEQRRSQHAKIAKRDAIIDVQAQFFDNLRQLYTWPLDQLTFAQTSQVRTFWESHLNNARRCAYRAETIDPNHYGHLRYDIMCEIVKLETRRLNEFLSTFDHYRDLIYTNDITKEDESNCDDIMLSYFDQTQTNVILAITPSWIEEARRPPLTWYGFLAPPRNHGFMADLPREDRILAPEYYD